MLSTLTRLNGKRLARNYNPKQRLECQFCKKIIRIKKLEFEQDCPHCGKKARYADQELISETKYIVAARKFALVWRVKYPLTEIEAIFP